MQTPNPALVAVFEEGFRLLDLIDQRTAQTAQAKPPPAEQSAETQYTPPAKPKFSYAAALMASANRAKRKPLIGQMQLSSTNSRDTRFTYNSNPPIAYLSPEVKTPADPAISASDERKAGTGESTHSAQKPTSEAKGVN